MQTVALVAQNNTGESQDSTRGAEPVKEHEGDIFMKCSKILSPMTGEAVGLGEVPDPVFSQKIIGDGMAVIPSEGKLLSPVDGEIVSVADTKHAFGLRTAEGLELLIHMGLETVHLNGECFQVFVKPGDQVKAGDLLAEVDHDEHRNRTKIRRSRRSSGNRTSCHRNRTCTALRRIRTVGEVAVL